MTSMLLEWIAIGGIGEVLPVLQGLAPAVEQGAEALAT